MSRAAASLTVAITLFVGVLAGCGNVPGAPATTIRNDTPKVDTAGKTIDAHEGQIVWDGAIRRYWLIGNGYGCGYQWVHAAAPWCGFHAYTSPDLVTWTDRGLIFDPRPAFWQKLCGKPRLGCFDIRFLRDPAGAWVAWFNVYGAASGYYVMSAPSLGGPWHLNAEPRLAVGNNHPYRGNGAGSLFRDRDGKGYIAYTAWTLGGQVVVEQLDPHYVTGTGRHMITVQARDSEAPSLFRAPDGAYQITYDSPGCAWCAGTGTSYATAPRTIRSGWARRGSISGLSCNGQAAAAVSPLPVALYLWASDQWTNLAPGPRLVPPWTGTTDVNYSQHWNQTTATQSWEPLRFGANSTIGAIRCPATVNVPILS